MPRLVARDPEAYRSMEALLAGGGRFTNERQAEDVCARWGNRLLGDPTQSIDSYNPDVFTVRVYLREEGPGASRATIHSLWYVCDQQGIRAKYLVQDTGENRQITAKWQR